MDRYSVVTVSVPKNNSHFSLRRRFAICLNRIVSIFSDISHSNLRFLISLIANSSSTMRVSVLDTSVNELHVVFQERRLLAFMVWMSHAWRVSLFTFNESRYSTTLAISFRISMSSRVVSGNVSMFVIGVMVKDIGKNTNNLRFLAF